VGFSDHAADFAATGDRPGTAVADLQGVGVPPWLSQALAEARGAADAVLLTPHWGSNFTSEPPRHVRAAVAVLRQQATLIAGHSAHAFHGVERNVLYDLGDFLETYAGKRATGSLAERALRRGVREIKSIGVEIASAVSRREGSGSSAGSGPRQPLYRRLLGRSQRLLLEARASRLRDDLGLLFLVTLDASGPKRLEALPLKLAHSRTQLAKGEDAAWISRRFRRACRALGTTAAEEGERLVITWR
jgi:hypothetical protein